MSSLVHIICIGWQRLHMHLHHIAYNCVYLKSMPELLHRQYHNVTRLSGPDKASPWSLYFFYLAISSNAQWQGSSLCLLRWGWCRPHSSNSSAAFSWYVLAVVLSWNSLSAALCLPAAWPLPLNQLHTFGGDCICSWSVSEPGVYFQAEDHFQAHFKDEDTVRPSPITAACAAALQAVCCCQWSHCKRLHKANRVKWPRITGK